MGSLNSNNYEQALRTLSAMADELETKNKTIENLALKVELLSKVVLKAGINIDDYITINDVVQSI